MFIEKTFETKLTLLDVNEIYNYDLKNLCIIKLNKIYAGKCFKSCFIIKVTEISQHSLRNLNDILDGSFNVSVRFRADCVVFLSGEIIPRCKITQIEPNNKIYAEAEYSSILIECNDPEVAVQKTSFYMPNMNIPVIVYKARYIPYRNKISVIAYPFVKTRISQLPSFLLAPLSIPKKDGEHVQLCYKIDTENKAPNLKLLQLIRNKFIKNIKINRDIIKGLPKDVVNFFTELFAMKNIVTRIKNEKEVHVKFDNVADIEHITNGYIYYDNNNSLLELDLVWLPSSHQEDNNTLLNTIFVNGAGIVINNLESIIIIILNRYIHNQLTIIDMATAYPDIQKIKKEDAIWKAWKN